jgi:hypothetical protein
MDTTETGGQANLVGWGLPAPFLEAAVFIAHQAQRPVAIPR